MYKEMLAHDTLLELLNMCDNPHCFEALKEFCVQFSKASSTAEAQEFLQSTDGKVFTGAISLMQTFCKCVGNLFQWENMKSDARDVIFFTQYNGSDGFPLAVRQILSQPEPAETRKGLMGETRTKSRATLQSMVNDVVKTAASHVEGAGLMEQARVSLKSAQDVLADGLTSGFHAHVKSILENWPRIRKSVRKGSCAALEGQLIKFLIHTATKVGWPNSRLQTNYRLDSDSGL